MIYLPCRFACLCGATPNGHMTKFFKIDYSWRKYSMEDPTSAYLKHRGNEHPRTTIKFFKKQSSLRKEFLDKLKNKFENCQMIMPEGYTQNTFLQVAKHFGWVAENGNEFLLSFFEYKAKGWKEIDSLGSFYAQEKIKPTIGDVYDEYNKFLNWLYSELFGFRPI